MGDSLENFFKNWSIFMQVCKNNWDDVDTKIGLKIINIAMKRNKENMLAMLKSISVTLHIMQRGNCNLLNVVNIWKKFKGNTERLWFLQKIHS